MMQFTQQQIDNFRARGDYTQKIINLLLEETKTIREHELVIPKTGRATWQLYYYCPACSVRLIFDIDSPDAYECPLCHKKYSDEPYEGAWWRWLNTFNYTSAYYLCLLYLLTNESEYALRAKEVITTYAKYYPDYEVHGDIPYNNPGRANSQTLDEAIFLRYFAYSYDLIEDVFSEEEKNMVKNNLFRIGADHLRKYRTDQLHNHEVVVDSAMAVLGIILDDEELINHALYEKYGLYYQLETGMLSDGFWFEGSTAYHYFALMNFSMFEKFAINTKWGNFKHPNYRKMLQFGSKILKSDNTLPMLNDCQIFQSNPDAYEVYEFAYAQLKDDALLKILQGNYQKKERFSIEAFFYGVEDLPVDPVSSSTPDYHNEDGSGLTVLRRKNDQYFLFKHGPYGGEHDHYDKLQISYSYDGQSVSTDLGTTGYGAVLHYDYYKNTVSHNTIVINEMNQAPSRGKVRKLEYHDDYTYIDAEVKWSTDYQIPDSFVIKQWSDEDYEGVIFRRQLVFSDDFIVDVGKIICPSRRKIDNSLHFSGVLVGGLPEDSKVVKSMKHLAEHTPYSYLTNCKMYHSKDVLKLSFLAGDVETDLFCKTTKGYTILAEGYDNPSIRKIPFVIERVEDISVCFAHVIASRKANDEALVKNVTFTEKSNELIITIFSNKGEQEFMFNLE